MQRTLHSDASLVGGHAEAELKRLQDTFSHVEDCRRREKMQFEDRVRRIQSELEQCRAQNMTFQRQYEESESLKNALQSKLAEVLNQRDTFERELLEAKKELNRRRAAMRQFSGPLPSASLECATVVTVATASDRKSVTPLDAGAPNGKESSFVRASGGGPTSARGVVANRSRARSTEKQGRSPAQQRSPTGERPVEINVVVPRSLSPAEIAEMQEMANAAEESPSPLPQKAPVASASSQNIWSVRQSPQGQPQQQQWQPAMSVHRQVSAPYQYVPAFSEQMVGAPAHYPTQGASPLVRMVSANLPNPASWNQQIMPNPGSATIPTASSISLAQPSGSSLPTMSSQARLPVQPQSLTQQRPATSMRQRI